MSEAAKSLSLRTVLRGKYFGDENPNDCALANRSDADVRAELPAALREEAGAWEFLAMPDPDDALLHDVGLVRACPLLAGEVRVEGWRYHVETGVVERVLGS